MSTALDQWLAAQPNYLPHYNRTQEIIATTILATIAVIIVQCRRGRQHPGSQPPQRLSRTS